MNFVWLLTIALYLPKNINLRIKNRKNIISRLNPSIPRIALWTSSIELLFYLLRLILSKLPKKKFFPLLKLLYFYYKPIVLFILYILSNKTDLFIYISYPSISPLIIDSTSPSFFCLRFFVLKKGINWCFDLSFCIGASGRIVSE